MKLAIRHIFRNGQTEVGTGEPGYRWVDAYSEVTADGYTNPVPMKEQRAMARRDGYTLQLHKTEEEARKALLS